MKKRGYTVWLAVIVSIFMLLTYIPGATLTKASAAIDSGSLLEVQALSSDPTVVATIPLAGNIGSIAVNPATNRIYVANGAGNSVYVIDGNTNSIVATVNVGSSPRGIAVNLNTNRIYVTNELSNSVSVIDGVTNGVVATVMVGLKPFSIAVNSDTNRIYVTNETNETQTSNGSIWVIDGATNNIVAMITVGLIPSSVAVNPGTNRIYVVNLVNNSVSVIDGVTNSVVATLLVGSRPWRVAVNPNNNLIYITSLSNNSVSVFDGDTYSIVATINLLKRPTDIAVNPNANRIYLANGESVIIIDSVTNNIVATVNVDSSSSIAVNPNTNRIYVGSYSGGYNGSKSVSVIQDRVAQTITGTVASVPVPTSGLNEYALSILIVSSSDSRFSFGQQVWCAATTTDFPNLLTVGATVSGNLVNSSGWWVLKPGAEAPPPAIQTITGTVASVPVPTGSLNEYALSLQIVSSSNFRFSIGQQVWCAARTTDFPDLLTVGATLTGTLDNSSGWWVLKPDAATPPPTIGIITGTLASVPVPTGGLNEYAFSMLIASSSDSRFIIGQQVWCAARTTDFPNLLTVGATLSGNLDNSLGWWVLKKAV